MSSEEGSGAPAATEGLFRSLFMGGQVTPAIALFNPTTGTLSILHASPTTLFQPKPGPLPATKESIAALPTREAAEEDRDCAICLEEFETGVELSEMPCNHCFHRDCIQRWLGINGSCPVCRYAMPVDDRASGEDKTSSSEENDDSERARDEDTTASTPVTLLFTLVIDRPTASEAGSSPRVTDGTGDSEGSSAS